MAGPSTAALKKFEESFKKSFGEKAIRTPGNNVYKTISTGSLDLDSAMGVGGYIKGRITELWGPPSGGKTSLTLIGIGIAQKQYPDEIAGFIDVEQTFDEDLAVRLGVDLSKLKVVTPETAEDVADIMKEMLQSSLFSIIVLDSIGAMLPKEEFEKDAEQVSMGTIAKIITRMVKIAAVYAPKYDTAVLIINQVRANLGFGGDTTTGGGFALKHVSTHKLHVKQASTAYTIGSDEKKINVGYEMGVKVEKNKVAPPGRNAKFDFFILETEKYGPVGIDKATETFKVGERQGVIVRGGATYTFPDGEKIAGKAESIEYLRSQPKLLDQVRKQVIDNLLKDVVVDKPLSDEQIEQLSE